MEMTDIIALARAGYSREEIAAMQEPETEQKPETKQEPEPKQEPETKQEPEAKQEPEMGETLTQLVEQMRGVVEAMQMQARNSAQQPPEETTDDIIANIIRPKGGKGGNRK